MPSLIPIFPLRLPAELKARAASVASARGMSLNALVVEAVAARVTEPERDEGETPSPAIVRRVGFVRGAQARNARCACGSGLKFKRCCGIV